MADLKQLKEERASLMSQITAISDKAKAENRNVTKEEADSVNQMYDKQVELRDQINAEERAIEMRSKLAENVEEIADDSKKSKEEVRSEVNRAFYNIMTRRASQKDLDIVKQFESRATDQSKTAGEGGYTVPTGFMAELEKTMAYYGTMLDRNLVRYWATPNGIDIAWPATDDTANKAVQVSEGASVASGTAAVFTSKTFKAYKWTSKIVKYTPELLSDSSFDFAMVLSDLFGERMGRGLNAAFTTGAGTTTVQGVVTGASAGKTTASETAITAAELLDLIYSLDRAYRSNAKLMMNDSTLKYIINLALSTDAKMANLFVPGANAGEPGYILGVPVVINNDMAAIGAGNVPIVIGDFKKYVTRFVGTPTFKTLFELYAATDELAAIMFQRVDGQVLNTAAFKKLTCADT